MATNIEEKRKTIANSKSDILTAKVIGNNLDPGLTNTILFDVLSRFIIVAIESVDRLPTNDKWQNTIVAVRRPQSLWITASNGYQSNPTNQQRSDFYGNTNTGLPSSPSVNAIGTITPSYSIGETIQIRKLSKSLQLNSSEQDSIFNSVFPSITNNIYDAPDNSGAVLPYIQNNKAQSYLKLLCLNAAGNNFYYPVLNKYQYEAFSLLQNINNPNTTNLLIQIFGGSYNGNSQVYNVNGGYIFSQSQLINIPVIDYEDMNIGNKQRSGDTGCIPLVVTTPNSFPVPQIRSTSTFVYTPMIVQNN